MKQQYIITGICKADNIKYYLHANNQLYFNICNISKRTQLKVYKSLQAAKNKLYTIKESYNDLTLTIETI